MKEVILSPDNPPREGDVFVHNGFKLERFDPESRTWQFGVAYVHEAFMYGLTVQRPEKVTGELVGEIVSEGCIYKLAGVCGLSEAVDRQLSEGKRVALVILEDN